MFILEPLKNARAKADGRPLSLPLGQTYHYACTKHRVLRLKVLFAVCYLGPNSAESTRRAANRCFLGAPPPHRASKARHAAAAEAPAAARASALLQRRGAACGAGAGASAESAAVVGGVGGAAAADGRTSRELVVNASSGAEVWLLSATRLRACRRQKNGIPAHRQRRRRPGRCRR